MPYSVKQPCFSSKLQSVLVQYSMGTWNACIPIVSHYIPNGNFNWFHKLCYYLYSIYLMLHMDPLVVSHNKLQSCGSKMLLESLRANIFNPYLASFFRIYCTTEHLLRNNTASHQWSLSLMYCNYYQCSYPQIN